MADARQARTPDRPGGGGKDAAFDLLRGAERGPGGGCQSDGGHRARVPANSDDRWIAQHLQAHAREKQSPVHLQIERETRSGGRGKDEIFKILGKANGNPADGLVTAAITAAFQAGSNDLWMAQQLQAFGAALNWSNDLKVLRMLKGFAPIDQPGILQLLLAASAPQLDNALQYMSQHHNTIILQMLYAANDADFGSFMGKIAEETHSASFLENVSTGTRCFTRISSVA